MYNESITLYQTYVFFLQKIVLMILLTNTIYNTTNLSDDKYLLVIYDRKSKLYKVMFVNKKLIIGYPFLAKLFGKHKVAVVEVQGILSILNAKLRQQSLLNSEIKRTAMENIQPLKRSRINKRGKN